MGSGESSCPLAAIGAGGTTSQFAVLVRAAGRCLLPVVYGLDRAPVSACLVVPSPNSACIDANPTMGMVAILAKMVSGRISSVLLWYLQD